MSGFKALTTVDMLSHNKTILVAGEEEDATPRYGSGGCAAAKENDGTLNRRLDPPPPPPLSTLPTDNKLSMQRVPEDGSIRTTDQYLVWKQARDDYLATPLPPNVGSNVGDGDGTELQLLQLNDDERKSWAAPARKTESRRTHSSAISALHVPTLTHLS